MAFGTGASSARGGSPGLRFTLYAVLSIVIMFLDQRGEYLEQVRYGLNIAAYPIQLAVSSPSEAWRWLQESAATRDALRAENARLILRNRDLELRSMRYEALAKENDQLRGLQEALPPVAARWLVAEIVDIQLNNLRQRVLINRGTRNGVFKAQAVLDDKGLLGQTTHVGPWSAEVILITDPEHAVPVQIERTGLRTIAVGTGDTGSLALPYLPANADVQAGDMLLTSGLGGVFPAGYPVGRISEVHRDAVQPLAQVRAIPSANLNTDREVMLVWFREGHPAAPASAPDGNAKSGNANMQSQPAPLKRRAPASSQPSAAGANAGSTTSPKGAAPNLTVPNAAPQRASPGAAADSRPPGDAATLAAPANAPAPANSAPASKEQDIEEGPPTEEDIPPKPEPKAKPEPGTPKPQATTTQRRLLSWAGRPPPATTLHRQRSANVPMSAARELA